MDECVACDGDGIRRINNEVEVVLLGDVGHFGTKGSPTGDYLTWKAAYRWADVILFGNHDIACFAPQHAFRDFMAYPPEAIHTMILALNEGKVKLAHASHGFLITHAGLHAAFRDQHVDETLKSNPYAFAAWINEVTNPRDDKVGITDFEKIAIRDAIHTHRGGSAPAGGILWRDISEKLYEGFRQVFGHSADHKERKVNYCNRNQHTRVRGMFKDPSYCIDVGGPDEYADARCLAGIYLPDETTVRVDL